MARGSGCKITGYVDRKLGKPCLATHDNGGYTYRSTLLERLPRGCPALGIEALRKDVFGQGRATVPTQIASGPRDAGTPGGLGTGDTAPMHFKSLIGLLLAVVALGLTHPLARADSTSEAPGKEPIRPSMAVPLDFPMLNGALAIASDYWAARGIALPPIAGVYEIGEGELFDGAGGFSESPGNQIWIARWLLENLSSPYIHNSARVTFCYIVLHERGHNAGLQHSDAAVFPIMGVPDEVGPGFWRKEVAPRCYAWAKNPRGT